MYSYHIDWLWCILSSLFSSDSRRVEVQFCELGVLTNEKSYSKQHNCFNVMPPTSVVTRGHYKMMVGVGRVLRLTPERKGLGSPKFAGRIHISDYLGYLLIGILSYC